VSAQQLAPRETERETEEKKRKTCEGATGMRGELFAGGMRGELLALHALPAIPLGTCNPAMRWCCACCGVIGCGVMGGIARGAPPAACPACNDGAIICTPLPIAPTIPIPRPACCCCCCCACCCWCGCIGFLVVSVTVCLLRVTHIDTHSCTVAHANIH